MGMRRVRVGLAQVNPAVGAVETNARLVIDWIDRVFDENRSGSSASCAPCRARLKARRASMGMPQA